LFCLPVQVVPRVGSPNEHRPPIGEAPTNHKGTKRPTVDRRRHCHAANQQR
jgi:3-oxoacyl-[acyl-carrier-protein] synthase III